MKIKLRQLCIYEMTVGRAHCGRIKNVIFNSNYNKQRNNQSDHHANGGMLLV